MAKKLSEREELLPEPGQYSVVKVDLWKAPSDEDFAYKVGEIESLDADPITVAGHGESIVILDDEGSKVSRSSGPDHPTKYTTRKGDAETGSFGKVIKSLLEDHQENNPPYDQTRGELGKAVEKIETAKNEALFKTLTTALNYQRPASPHYATFGELWDKEQWLFRPETIIKQKEIEDIVEVFEESGVRFPRKDAEIWYDLSLKLYEDYDSNPLNIFAEADYDFEQVEEIIRDNTLNKGYMSKDFPYLRGQKIRPLWLRFMKPLVPEGIGYENTEVAVDTHIIEITNRLCDTEYENKQEDKEQIREFWQKACEAHGINPIRLDVALWYINRDWEKWGKEYLQNELNSEGLKLGEVSPT